MKNARETAEAIVVEWTDHPNCTVDNLKEFVEAPYDLIELITQALQAERERASVLVDACEKVSSEWGPCECIGICECLDVRETARQALLAYRVEKQ